MSRLKPFSRATAGIAALAVVLTACSSSSGTTSNDEIGDMGTEFLTIATGSSSGVYYQVGATISKVLADELDSDTSAQPTGGSVENMNLLADGNAELGIVSSDAIYYAQNGEGPFDGKPIDGQMAVMTMFPNTFHLVARKSSNIESIDDLRGKTVAVGDIGSGVELNTKAVLAAQGMTYDDLSADHLSYAESAEQMANGHVDAMFASSGVPNPAVVELGTQTEIVTVPIDGEDRNKAIEKYDYFQPAVVPASAYGDSDDVETLGVVNHLLVSPELSEEAVYDITASIFGKLERIQSSHSEAKGIELENATEGLAVPLHPGAQKYFEEHDIELPEVASK